MTTIIIHSHVARCNLLTRPFLVVPGVKSPHVICTLSFHTSAPASNKQDFYTVLEVPRTATQKEIKKAYYQVCVCDHFLCSVDLLY
jgi:DnaJ family protein A protein 3